MLADFEKVEAEDKDVLKADIKELKERLAALPQKLRDKKIPVLVLIEGWAAAGKGSLIKELISELDPRFYNVVSPVIVPEKESRYPFLYPYATAIPENGKICTGKSPKRNSSGVCARSMSLSASSATEAICS